MYEILSDSIIDTRINVNQFRLLNIAFNEKSDTGSTIIHNYKKSPKSYNDLESQGYIKIDHGWYWCYETIVDFIKVDNTLQIKNKEYETLLDSKIINKYLEDERKRKGYDIYNHLPYTESELNVVKSNLLRFYCYIKLENKRGIDDFNMKEVKERAKILHNRYNPKYLLQMTKDLGLYGEGFILCEFNKKPVKNRCKKIKLNDIEYQNSINQLKILNSKQDIYNYKVAIPVENKDLIPKNKSGIYTFTDENGEVMYIGKAKDFKSRIYAHVSGITNTKEFHSYFKYVSLLPLSDYEETSEFVEKDLIKTLKPKYNVIHNEVAC